MLRRLFSFILAILIGVFTFFVVDIKALSQEKEDITIKTVGNFKNFLNLIEDAIKKNPYVGYATFENSLDSSFLHGFQSKSYSQDRQASYSETNVQVEGVDEADVVKTDGTYIYLKRYLEDIRKDQVLIIKAYPVDDMKIVSKVDMENDLKIEEFYIDSKNLIVICQRSKLVDIRPYSKERLKNANDKMVIKNRIIYDYKIETVAFVYDISDKSNPQKIREVVLDGRYITSRKIGQNVHIVTRKFFPYEIYITKDYKEQDFLPYYSDSINKNLKKNVYRV